MSDQWIRRRDMPAAVARITGGGKKPHEGTIRRWYSKGVRGVRLEVTWVGGEVFTTERQIRLFFDQCDIARECEATLPKANRHYRLSKTRARLAVARVMSRVNAIGPDPSGEPEPGRKAV